MASFSALLMAPKTFLENVRIMAQETFLEFFLPAWS